MFKLYVGGCRQRAGFRISRNPLQTFLRGSSHRYYARLTMIPSPVDLHAIAIELRTMSKLQRIHPNSQMKNLDRIFFHERASQIFLLRYATLQNRVCFKYAFLRKRRIAGDNPRNCRKLLSTSQRSVYSLFPEKERGIFSRNEISRAPAGASPASIMLASAVDK